LCQNSLSETRLDKEQGMLRNGTAAPEFSLTTHDGRQASLAELRGSAPFLLLFFRGAFCPTARMNLASYNNVAGRMRAIGCGLAAVSADAPETLSALHARLELEFPLLSDAGFVLSRQYGIYESDDGEGPRPHGEPALFIIDVDGNVAYSQVMTGPKGLANPSEMALMLLYMTQNGGRY
jgi:peroxiredoxin